MKKPSRASGYDPGHVHHVRSTCLYVATKLGDLIDDVVVIGGLVPSLLIDQEAMSSSDDLHVGTLDLDVGLALAVFHEQRYAALAERLRQAGFSPDQNDQGQLTRQRWKIDGDVRVTVDFLIAPSLPGDKPGTLRNIEKDFAAIIAPGLHLAFADRERVRLKGHTLFGEAATRDIWVAGPGAFLILKALASGSAAKTRMPTTCSTYCGIWSLA